jgi:hypothetical protein
MADNEHLKKQELLMTVNGRNDKIIVTKYCRRSCLLNYGNHFQIIVVAEGKSVVKC